MYMGLGGNFYGFVGIGKIEFVKVMGGLFG